jgi:putative ABC transport system permease protein
MSLWRQLRRGFRTLTNRTAADQDVADEVEHFLEQAADEWTARGLSPDEARRAARLEVGSPTAVREAVGAYGWENQLARLAADLRYGARRLARSPGFTTVTVVTLALGIGATTAIFSAVNPILFEPLPYPNARRVTMVWDTGRDGSRVDVTFGTFRELRARSRSFDALAVMRPWQPTITGPAEPERFVGQRVTAEYFRALGVSPTLGRDFQASEDQINGPKVVILSDALWRRRFGADPTLLGRQITLDGSGHTVVGVMPATFENVLAPSADVWSPLQYDASLPPGGREWGHHLRMVGRLRAGVRIGRVDEELDAIARTTVPESARAPQASLKNGFIVNSLQDDVTRAVKPALVAVFGAVLVLLGIACVNVTNLLLARGAERRGDFALRAALGAARPRLIRQVLTESILLAVLGGAVGIVVAKLGVRALGALGPPGLPRAAAIGVDGATFAFAFGIAALIGIVVGLVPALHASRGDLLPGLHHSARHTARGQRLTRRVLVVAEVALALVLLVSAGLLLRSLQHLFAISPGFDSAHVLTMQVQTSGRRFDTDAIHQFFAQALDAVRQVPAVSAAGFTSQLPLSGDFDKYGIRWESSPTDHPDEDRSAFRYAISPDYLPTMGIPLRKGRRLDAHDGPGAPVAVLISESLATRKFPGVDPVGQRLHLGRTDLPWYTVVGVVGDVKQASLAMSQSDAVYIPTTQWYSPDNALWLVVRAQGDTAALAPAIKATIWSVDKDQPIVRVATMDGLLAASAGERRFVLVLLEAFAIVALVLAAMGLYGVLSGSVTERTREIGVRTALGATRGHIVALVVRQGLALTALGVVTGVIAARIASRALVTLLFGVSPIDATTYLGVVMLLFGVSALACSAPAWRAALVDPAITLRAE